MGDVGVATDDGTWHRLAGAQPRAALALLALERHRTVKRDELAELLWGEDVPDHWPGAVRGVVAKVRAFLAGVGLPPTTLTSEGGSLQLNLPTTARVDVEEAAAAVDDAEAALADRRWDDARAAAERAVQVLAGGLLGDHDAEWVDLRRRSLDSLGRRGRHVVGAALLGAGQAAPAIAAATALLADDPFDEAGHRLLIRAHHGEGSARPPSALTRRVAGCWPTSWASVLPGRRRPCTWRSSVRRPNRRRRSEPAPSVDRCCRRHPMRSSWDATPSSPR